jgi:hypothetical protein
VPLGFGKFVCRERRDENGELFAVLDDKKVCPDCGKHCRDFPKYVGRPAHGFRRTCAHELEVASVPRDQAIKITDHETPSTYARYADIPGDEENKNRQLEAPAKRRAHQMAHVIEMPLPDLQERVQ